MSNTFIEPTWGSVREAMQESISRFVKEPATPFDLTGAFMRLLQFHFSDANRIANTTLKTLIWNSDIKQTAILIAPGFNRDIKSESKKPALFIERGPVKPVVIPTPLKSVNIQVWATINGAPTELTDNNKRFKYISGTHSIICEGLTPAQSELLAEEIYVRFMYFAPVIENDFSLESFDVGEMSPLQQREEKPTPTDVVAVSFTWSKYYFWETVVETPV